MAVVIANNISSTIAQRLLGDATRDLSKVSERLSSGLRINKAADDAAGLQISEGLRTDSKVLAQAIRNVNDGLSLAAIAEGAMQQLSSVVIRQRELAEQAASGTYSATQRLALHKEAHALFREYNRIIQSTTFNGLRILDGNDDGVRIQSGYGINGSTLYNIGQAFGTAAGSGAYGNLVTTPAAAESTSISFSGVTVTPPSSIAEEITLTFLPDIANYIGGSYFRLSDGISTYNFWFSVDGGGSDPGLEGTTFEIALFGGFTAQNIIDAIVGAVNSSGAPFAATDGGNESYITFTAYSAGDIPDVELSAQNGEFDIWNVNNGAGLPEYSALTIPGGTEQFFTGDYFTLSDGTDDFYFWFNVDGGGGDPSLGGTGVEINLTTGMSQEDVFNAIISAVNSSGGRFYMGRITGNQDDLYVTTYDAVDVTDISYQGSGWSAGVSQHGDAGGSSNYTPGGYILLNNGTTNHVFWFNVDGSGSAPGIPGTKHQINISDGQSGTTVATAVAAAILAAGGFSVNQVGAALTVTNTATGPAANYVNASGGPVSMSLLVDGTSGGSAGTANGTIASNQYTAHLQTVDLNNDGNLDFYYTNYGDNRIWTVLSNGNGTFLAPRSAISVSAPNTEAPWGDVNGDGIVDIIANQQPGFPVMLAIGNGDGTFRAPTSIATGLSGTTFSLGLKDMNGDGALDLITRRDTAISISFGNNNGTFKSPTLYSVGSGNNFKTGDVNNDGIQDIIAHHYGGTFEVLIGNGNGSFRASYSVPAVTSANLEVSVGDVNGDGFLDVAASGTGTSNRIFLGNGDGTFRAPNTFGATNGLIQLKFVDLNGDGNMDLIGTSHSNGSTNTFLGNGNGTFSIGATYASGGSASYGVAVSDFNNDGAIDFVTANYSSGGLSIWLGNVDPNGRRNNYIEALDLLTVQGARDALVYTGTVLTRVNRELGNLGAIQSRMATSANVLINQRTNFESAKSTITDADMALESSSLLRARILQRAAASVLAQANQQPALALRLLGRR